MAEKRFETTDFYVAVYFKAQGQKIVETRKTKGNQTIFCFDFAGQDKEVIKFYNDELQISPLKYSRSISELKGMIRRENVN